MVKNKLFVGLLTTLSLSTTLSYGLDYDNYIKNMSDSCYERKNEVVNDMINATGDDRIDIQLNRLPYRLREELTKEGIKIQFLEGLNDMYSGEICWGQYTYDDNLIELDSNNESITRSCMHEIGHSIEDIHDEVLRSADFVNSWISDEVYLEEDYMREYDNEYWAETFQMYFDGELDQNTVIYKIIDEFIKSYK